MGFKANFIGCGNYLVLRQQVKGSFAYVTDSSLVDANNVYANGVRDFDVLKESLGME